MKNFLSYIFLMLGLSFFASCSVKDVPISEHEESIGDGVSISIEQSFDSITLNNQTIDEEMIHQKRLVLESDDKEKVFAQTAELASFFSTALISQYQGKGNYGRLFTTYGETLIKAERLAQTEQDKNFVIEQAESYYRLLLEGCDQELNHCHNIDFISLDFYMPSVLLLLARTYGDAKGIGIEDFSNIMKFVYTYQQNTENPEYALIFLENVYNLEEWLRESEGEEDFFSDFRRPLDYSLHLVEKYLDAPNFPGVKSHFTELIRYNDFNILKLDDVILNQKTELGTTLFSLIGRLPIKEEVLNFYSRQATEELSEYMELFREVDINYLSIIHKAYKGEWGDPVAYSVYRMTEKNEEKFLKTLKTYLKFHYEQSVKKVNSDILNYYVDRKNQITQNNVYHALKIYAPSVAGPATRFLQRRNRLDRLARTIVEDLSTKYRDSYNYLHSFEHNYLVDVMIPQMMILEYYRLKKDFDVISKEQLARNVFFPSRQQTIEYINIGISVQKNTFFDKVRAYKNILEKDILKSIEHINLSTNESEEIFLSSEDLFYVLFTTYIREDRDKLERNLDLLKTRLSMTRYLSMKSVCSELERSYLTGNPLSEDLRPLSYSLHDQLKNYLFINDNYKSTQSAGRTNLMDFYLPYDATDKRRFQQLRGGENSYAGVESYHLNIIDEIKLDFVRFLAESVYREFRHSSDSSRHDQRLITELDEWHAMRQDYDRRLSEYNKEAFKCSLEFFRKEFELRDHVIKREREFLETVYQAIRGESVIIDQKDCSRESDTMACINEEIFNKTFGEADGSALKAGLENRDYYKDYIQDNTFIYSFTGLQFRIKQYLEEEIPNIALIVPDTLHEHSLYANEKYVNIDLNLATDQDTFAETALSAIPTEEWHDHWFDPDLMTFAPIEDAISMAMEYNLKRLIRDYSQGSYSIEEDTRYVVNQIMDFSNILHLNEQSRKTLRGLSKEYHYPSRAIEYFFLDKLSDRALNPYDKFSSFTLRYYLTRLLEIPQDFYNDFIRKDQVVISGDEDKFQNLVQDTYKGTFGRFIELYDSYYDAIKERAELDLNAAEPIVRAPIAYKVDLETAEPTRFIEFRNSGLGYINSDFVKEYENTINEFHILTNDIFRKTDSQHD